MRPYALFLGLAAAQTQSAPRTISPPPRGQIGEAPVSAAVQGVGAERTIAEFMDVCFRPKWNVADFRAAVKSSDFAYREEPTKDPSSSLGWTATRGFLEVNVGRDFSQCALSIGSNQPRTGKQILAMLKPAVEVELGREVQENDGKFYLQWTDATSGDVERIALAGSGADPKQAIWYVFDRTAPGVREKLERQMSAMPSSKQPE